MSFAPQSNIEWNVLWPVVLALSVALSLQFLFNSDPFITCNLLACMYPLIHLGLVVFQFVCACTS